jgi:hypothetical protein
MSELNKVHTFKDGNMNEGGDWTIEENSECDDTFGVKPCPHCYDIREVKHYYRDGSGFYVRTEWKCPYTIVLLNEGGCNSTSLCAQCARIAMESLGI